MFLKLQNCVSIEIIKATRLSVVNTWTCTYSVYLYVGAHVLKTEQNIGMIESLGKKNLQCEVFNQWKLKKKRKKNTLRNIGQVEYTHIDTVYCMYRSLDDFFTQT